MHPAYWGVMKATVDRDTQSSPSVRVGFQPSGVLPAVADSGLLLAVAGQSCRSSLMAGMADVLGRPFTRLRRLAVSPLRSPPCGLRCWCRRRLLPWFRRAVVSGIEGKYVKTLESGVAVVIFGFSFLWIFSVIE